MPDDDWVPRVGDYVWCCGGMTDDDICGYVLAVDLNHWYAQVRADRGGEDLWWPIDSMCLEGVA